ncbi:MAG: hypothetical protein Q8L73_00120 [Methylotenera sp.]|nr:hypothetical protein [Methylotenera sp.]
MKNLYARNIYNWGEIINTPVSLELARIKAPRISDSTATNQIITALHEAIHLIYAVWFGIYVNFIAVSTRKNGGVFWKGRRVLGFTLAYDYDEGKPAIYSTCAAAIFELEINDRNSNELVQAELAVAYKAAKNLRWPDPYDRAATEFIIENVLNNLTGHVFSVERGPIGRLWWLIRAVAVAILTSRTKSTGVVSPKNTQIICKYVRKYCRPDSVGLGDYFPDKRMKIPMSQDIKWLKKYS